MRIIARLHWPQDVVYIEISKKNKDNRYYCFADEKRERIYLGKGWNTDPKIDAFVFHEYRHILHRREGLFCDYYAPFWSVRNRIIADPDGWISFALFVEKDCDTYAKEITNIDLGRYPEKAVAHYAFAERRRKKQNKKCKEVFND